MGVFTEQITEHHKVYETISYSGNMMLGDPGTFNGVVCTNAIDTPINQRWLGFGLFDNFDDVAQLQHKLPLNYISDTSIDIIVNWQSSVTTGNCYYNTGIGGIDSGGQWASDSDMTYKTTTAYTVSGTSNGNNIQTHSFNVTDFIPGEEIIFVMYRETTTANGLINDTMSSTMRVMSIEIKYLINSIGTTNAS